MSSMIQSAFGPHRVVACAAMVSLGLLTGAAVAADGKGYTYKKISHDATLGVDQVGYSGGGNPYVGDTSCAVALPILCVNVDGSPRPNYDPPAITASQPDEFYAGWAEGHFASTLPVRGDLIKSADYGAHLCRQSFGKGWRMLEHHDGRWVYGMDSMNHGNSIGSQSPWPTGDTNSGGWHAWGHGNLRTDTRFWVHINDQRGNCWDQ